MSKFGGLTSNIAEKSSSRAKDKGRRLKKGRKFDDDRASSDLSSEAES